MVMERKKITISKKGDDGYRVISVRLKENTLASIDTLATQTNRSRNEVINILLENSVSEVEVKE